MSRKERNQSLRRKQSLRILRRAQTQRYRPGRCLQTIPFSDLRQPKQARSSPIPVPYSAKMIGTEKLQRAANNRSFVARVKLWPHGFRGNQLSHAKCLKHSLSEAG